MCIRKRARDAKICLSYKLVFNVDVYESPCHIYHIIFPYFSVFHMFRVSFVHFIYVIITLIVKPIINVRMIITSSVSIYVYSNPKWIFISNFYFVLKCDFYTDGWIAFINLIKASLTTQILSIYFIYLNQILKSNVLNCCF